jgi:hypothetical protein
VPIYDLGIVRLVIGIYLEDRYPSAAQEWYIYAGNCPSIGRNVSSTHRHPSWDRKFCFAGGKRKLLVVRVIRPSDVVGTMQQSDETRNLEIITGTIIEILVIVS